MEQNTKEKIENIIKENEILLFMKGTPVFPQCGFSSMVSQVLSHIGVEFKGVDVLAEPTLRDGIKAFSDWPTIPQLYIQKEFIGGCDIVKEMYESGELAKLFESKGISFKAKN